MYVYLFAFLFSSECFAWLPGQLPLHACLDASVMFSKFAFLFLLALACIVFGILGCISFLICCHCLCMPLPAKFFGILSACELACSLFACLLWLLSCMAWQFCFTHSVYRICFEKSVVVTGDSCILPTMMAQSENVGRFHGAHAEKRPAGLPFLALYFSTFHHVSLPRLPRRPARGT